MLSIFCLQAQQTIVRRVSRQNENMIPDTSFWCQNDPPGMKLSFWRLTNQVKQTMAAEMYSWNSAHKYSGI